MFNQKELDGIEGGLMFFLKPVAILVWATAFALVSIAAFTPLAKAAETGFTWQHFGAAPYASSRDEAMRTRESAFTKLGLPAPVIALFIEVTKKPGEKIRLVNGDKLSAMLSKGGVVHQSVVVAFVKPPVSGKMEYAAPAEKWQVVWEGKTYTVILPEICGNWSSVMPVTVSSECPNGWSVTANVWSLASMPEDLREKIQRAIDAAAARESGEATALDPYHVDAVSRTYGKELRERVKTRAPITDDIIVRRLVIDSTTGHVKHDPQTGKLMLSEIGVLRLVDGVGTFRFPDDPRQYVTGTTWPDYVKSPTESGKKHRLRIFPNEWRSCAVHMHGIVP